MEVLVHQKGEGAGKMVTFKERVKKAFIEQKTFNTILSAGEKRLMKRRVSFKKDIKRRIKKANKALRIFD